MSFTRSSAKPGGRPPQVLGHPCGYGGMRVALEAGVGAHRQLLPTCDREIKEASLLPSLVHIIYCEAKKCTLFLGSMLDKYEAAMEKGYTDIEMLQDTCTLENDGRLQRYAISTIEKMVACPIGDQSMSARKQMLVRIAVGVCGMM
jgi:hypothetical protein